MALQLNTTTSIVDYLKSKGQPSDFSSRSKTYKDLGFESRLGQFTGSSSQNLALLRHLQGQEKSSLPPPPAETPVSAPVPAPAPAPETPITGGQALSAIGYAMPTTEELTAKVMGSPGITLAQEKQNAEGALNEANAAADKQTLESKFAADKRQVEETLGRQGLFMSSVRENSVQTLIENLAAAKLGVDRKLAGQVLNSNFDLKQKIIDTVGTVVQQARQGKEDAIRHLEAAGLTIVGNKVVPTLAARNAERAQQTADLASEREMRLEQGQNFSQQLAIEGYKQRLQEFDATQEQRRISNENARAQLSITIQNARTSQERNAIMNEMNALKLQELTAVSPGQIVNAKTGLPVKISPAQERQFSGYDSLLHVYVPQLETLLNKTTTGGIIGRYISFAQTTPGLQKTLSQDQQELSTLIADLSNERLYTQSGAQINESEFKRIVATLPRLEYTNDQNRTQVESLKNTIKQIYNSRLKINGLSLAGDTAPFQGEGIEPMQSDIEYVKSLKLK